MAPQGGCEIPDTTLRAITLNQIQSILRHIEQRLMSGEVLSYVPENAGATLRTITDMKLIHLYDTAALVIEPAT